MTLKMPQVLESSGDEFGNLLNCIKGSTKQLHLILPSKLLKLNNNGSSKAESVQSNLDTIMKELN
jgi:hypothetical protein